jgi:hypothetical protein
LGLNSLDQRAKAAAQVIAMPYDQLSVALVATIHTRDSQQLTLPSPSPRNSSSSPGPPPH